MQEMWVWSLGGEVPWRRKWQPTPFFLSGESHGQRSPASYSLWGCNSRTWLSDWASKDIKSVLFSDSLWLFVYSSNRKLTVSPNKGQPTILPQRSCLAVVQSLSHVWLFVTPWTAALQASLSSTISWSLLKFMSDPARHSGISHNHGQQNSKETETEGEAEDQGQGGKGVSSW